MAAVKPGVCKAGELCASTGFVRSDGVARFCTCRQLRLQGDRLSAGGFPPAKDIPEKAWDLGCVGKVDHGRCDAFAGEFVTGRTPFRMCVFWPHERPGGGIISAAPAAYRVASFAAFVRPVVRITAGDLIDASFDRMGRAVLARKAEDPETFVLGVLGTDAQHAYAGPLLYNLLQRRTALPSAAAQTLFLVECPYSRLSSLYGSTFAAALGALPPLCGCRRP